MRKEMFNVEKIIELRKSLGFTQAEIARQIGISRQTYNNWESRICEPSASYLIRVCKVLQIENIIDITIGETK